MSKITVTEFGQKLNKIQDRIRAAHPDCIGTTFRLTCTKRELPKNSDIFRIHNPFFFSSHIEIRNNKDVNFVVYENSKEEIEFEGDVYNIKGRKMALSVAVVFPVILFN